MMLQHEGMGFPMAGGSLMQRMMGGGAVGGFSDMDQMMGMNMHGMGGGGRDGDDVVFFLERWSDSAPVVFNSTDGPRWCSRGSIAGARWFWPRAYNDGASRR